MCKRHSACFHGFWSWINSTALFWFALDHNICVCYRWIANWEMSVNSIMGSHCHKHMQLYALYRISLFHSFFYLTLCIYFHLCLWHSHFALVASLIFLQNLQNLKTEICERINIRCRIENINYNFIRKKCVVIYLPLFATLCLLFDTLLNGSVFSLNFDILKCALKHALLMEMFKVKKENKKTTQKTTHTESTEM